MAKNNEVRLQNLLEIKSTLLDAIRDDYARLLRTTERLRDENQALRARVTELEQKWWEEQDRDTKWVNAQIEAEKAMREAAERLDIEVEVDVVNGTSEPDYLG